MRLHTCDGQQGAGDAYRRHRRETTAQFRSPGWHCSCAFHQQRLLLMERALAWHNAVVRFQHDLDAVVLLVPEHLVALGRVREPQPVSDDKRRIDLTILDTCEQRTHITVTVRLT